MANSNDTSSIRVTVKAHKAAKEICDKKGYVLGAFCSNAIMEKIKSEKTIKRSVK